MPSYAHVLLAPCSQTKLKLKLNSTQIPTQLIHKFDFQTQLSLCLESCSQKQLKSELNWVQFSDSTQNIGNVYAALIMIFDKGGKQLNVIFREMVRVALFLLSVSFNWFQNGEGK